MSLRGWLARRVEAWEAKHPELVREWEIEDELIRCGREARERIHREERERIERELFP